MQLYNFVIFADGKSKRMSKNGTYDIKDAYGIICLT